MSKNPNWKEDREREIRSKVRCAIVCTFLVLFDVVLFVGLHQVNVKAERQNGVVESTPQIESETDLIQWKDEENIFEPTQFEDDITYIICDVVKFNETHFLVEMPDGEWSPFPLSMVEDAPIDDNGNPYFELVCFRVEYREHTTHYKVVGVR